MTVIPIMSVHSALTWQVVCLYACLGAVSSEKVKKGTQYVCREVCQVMNAWATWSILRIYGSKHAYWPSEMTVALKRLTTGGRHITNNTPTASLMFCLVIKFVCDSLHDIFDSV